MIYCGDRWYLVLAHWTALFTIVFPLVSSRTFRNNPGSMAAGQSLYVYLRSIGVPVTALKLPPPVKGKRPLAPMRAAVDARLFLRSLQKVSEIERAFAAVGLPTAVADLAGAIGLKTSTLRSRITKITNRRNTIAHQGDLFIGKKKRFVTKPISEREVVEWLNRIDDFVTRLDSYITANPRNWPRRRTGGRKLEAVGFGQSGGLIASTADEPAFFTGRGRHDGRPADGINRAK